MALVNFPSRESDGEAAAAALLGHPTFEVGFCEILSDFGPSDLCGTSAGTKCLCAQRKNICAEMSYALRHSCYELYALVLVENPFPRLSPW